jgi:hypothetical protein
MQQKFVGLDSEVQGAKFRLGECSPPGEGESPAVPTCCEYHGWFGVFFGDPFLSRSLAEMIDWFAPERKTFVFFVFFCGY